MRETRADIRDALADFESEINTAADLCHGLVLILRDLDGPDIAAALCIAELAESHATAARDDWTNVGRKACGLPAK